MVGGKGMSWAELADYYDQKQGDTGDLWHRALIDPPVLSIAGDVRSLRVLDLACGNGYLARKLARSGGIVVGVDASALIIAKAQAREQAAPLGITYHTSDAASLAMLRDASFDLVVCNMALMDMADPASALREAARVLVPGGRAVASLQHPCFDTGSGSTWLVERAMGGTTTLSRRVSRYREVFFEDTMPWRLAPDVRGYTRYYHRPLSWYVRAFSDAGFAITAMEEPEPTQEFVDNDDEAPWIQQVPLHLVIEAFKTSHAPAALGIDGLRERPGEL